MKYVFAAAVMFGLSVIPAKAASRFTPEEATLLQDGLIVTANDYILPGYEALGAATSAMTEGLKTYCAGEGPLDVAQSAFKDSFLAWQRISVIQVGPIMEAEGPMRFQLWPDPKGFSRRAIKSAIRQADPKLLEEGGLAERSIAMVNQTAMEDLLFGKLEPQSYACSLGVAIGSYQTTLANALIKAWMPGSPFRANYDTAATGNAAYPTVDALIRELLAGGVVYADRLRKQKIQRGLGTEAGQERPERSEAVKSGLGLKSIETSFRALAELYELPGGFFEVTPELDGSMDYFMLGQTAFSVAEAIAAEDRPLPIIAKEDPAFIEKLRNYGELTKLHEEYLKTGLPQTIGLTTGFTSADGD